MEWFSRIVCRSASTILLGGMLCASGPPQAQPKTAAGSEHSPAKKLSLTGVANFGEVTPWLYRGAQPSRQGFQELAAKGIDIVVDARLSGKGSEAVRTLPLGLANITIVSQYRSDWGMAFAGLVLMMLPTLAVYVLLQKHLTKGITAGAVKG